MQVTTVQHEANNTWKRCCIAYRFSRSLYCHHPLLFGSWMPLCFQTIQIAVYPLHSSLQALRARFCVPMCTQAEFCSWITEALFLNMEAVQSSYTVPPMLNPVLKFPWLPIIVSLNSGTELELENNYYWPAKLLACISLLKLSLRRHSCYLHLRNNKSCCFPATVTQFGPLPLSMDWLRRPVDTQ